MARRNLSAVDLTELFVLWDAGMSQVQMSERLGMDRKTVRKYLAPAVAEGLMPGAPPVSDAVWSQRISQWFPELFDTRLRQVTWPAIEEHRVYIMQQLKDGASVSAISSRLTTDQGLAASRSSLRRWIKANLAEEVARPIGSEPVEPKGEAEPGVGVRD